MSIWVFIISVALCLANEEASTCSTSYSPGPLTYTLGSTSETGYIIQAGGTNSWGTVTPSGSQVTIGLGPRFYLANACYSAFSPTVFEAVDLLGGSITFTVNLANVGCGMDAAFYLTSMPGPAASSNGDYYCDANCVGGQCCPEMDLMEANRHALQVTAHKCSSISSGCDAGGCAVNTQSITNGYGPSSSYTINTLSAFTVKISFAEASGVLSTITTVISQGSKSITLTHSTTNCGSGYLSAFGSFLGAGMVPIWSYWSGSMSWLDSPACSSDTAEVTGSFVFSNLIVSGSETSTKGPPPTPTAPVTPVAPGTLLCGTSGVTINQYWVEFKAPSGVTGSSTAATVSCSNTATVFSCTWYAAGSKYQCSCPTTGCTNPVPKVGGKTCVLDASLVLEDSSATTTLSSNQTMIIGVSVAAAVLAIIIVVLVVVFKKKDADQIEVA